MIFSSKGFKIHQCEHLIKTIIGKTLVNTNFRPEKNFGQKKNLGAKEFQFKKVFWSNKNFGYKNNLGAKQFCAKPKIVRPKEIIGPKKLWVCADFLGIQSLDH